eukprot:3322614-Rhodomonas_salina.1
MSGQRGGDNYASEVVGPEIVAEGVVFHKVDGVTAVLLPAVGHGHGHGQGQTQGCNCCVSPCHSMDQRGKIPWNRGVESMPACGCSGGKVGKGHSGREWEGKGTRSEREKCREGEG